MKYSDEILEEVRKRNDIVDIISQYVILKRRGRNYFGICPFHNEKTPSMSVSPDRQIFKCFGCGVGGGVFQFVSKIENISFVESVQLLAEKSGVELPKYQSNIDEAKIELKNKIYKINLEAVNFYYKNLFSKESKIAQQYVIKRKIDKETLKSFVIGYSGKNNELTKYLLSKNYTEKELLASDLIGKNDKGNLYDKFVNRLMIPIFDIRNRVIGFGGRVLDNSLPKYINSPNNLVYDKGRNLFGLNVAKKANNNSILKKLLVVEGYMDVISLHERGIKNVVASLGTALTDNQARLLRKNTEQVILGYDSDGAGQNAIIRAIEILKNTDLDIRILELEGAKDPDEYIIKYGKEKFEKCMNEAISIVEFKIKILSQQLNLENTADKVKFLNEISKILSEINNKIEREIYIDKISEIYKISKNSLFAEINEKVYKESSQKQLLPNNSIKSIERKNIVEKIDKKVLKREQLLIYILVNYPEKSLNYFKEFIDINQIKGEKNKIIISNIYNKKIMDIDNEKIMSWFEDEIIINYLSEILIYDFELDDIEKAMNDLKNTYKINFLKEEKEKIIVKLKDNNIDFLEKEDLEKRLTEIIVELTKIN